jgi:hypothetical protein
MFVNEDDIVKCVAEADITGAINHTLNAVKLVEVGAAADGAIEATEDQIAANIVGAVASIGPGNAGAITDDLGVNTSDIFDEDIFAAQREGQTILILLSGETTAIGTPLVSAGAGKVKAGSFSATITAPEMGAVVAYAKQIVTGGSADKAVKVALAL